ncbi:hypothetical protein AB4120_10035 [Cupriavidus sp. 2KB_3]|uniref:hypothetical protein n=1 Tax=Cupriavidus TaxID=106589 RepID=UPI0011EEBDD5|nr:hypothetical protein [Cupriavidus campinensis]
MALHVTNHVRPEALAQQKRLMAGILTRVAQATAASTFTVTPRPLFRATLRMQPHPAAHGPG